MFRVRCQVEREAPICSLTVRSSGSIDRRTAFWSREEERSIFSAGALTSVATFAFLRTVQKTVLVRSRILCVESPVVVLVSYLQFGEIVFDELSVFFFQVFFHEVDDTS